MFCHCLVTRQSLAIFRDLASTRLALDRCETVAGARRALQAEHLDGRRRAGFLELLATIVEDSADAAPFAARDDDVADHQRAGLHQHGRHRAAALLELRLDDDA